MDEADRILNLDFEKEVGSFFLFNKPPFSFFKQHKYHCLRSSKVYRF